MEKVNIYYDHWEYLWPFGITYGRLLPIVCGHLVYFPHFGMFGPRKIWQPWSQSCDHELQLQRCKILA
jgi:hypothetical protein